MNIPNIKKAEKYIGLYILDFGEYSSIGFTADEVAEVLESKKFSEVKIYKIHNASPDGQMEIKGVNAEIFDLEAGMLFHASTKEQAKSDYKKLVAIAVTHAPPARAKVHLAQINSQEYLVGLIYPAEADDEFSKWLTDNKYFTNGAARGGIDAISQYYDTKAEVLERHQLFPSSSLESKTGDKLLTSLKLATQR